MPLTKPKCSTSKLSVFLSLSRSLDIYIYMVSSYHHSSFQLYGSIPNHIYTGSTGIYTIDILLQNLLMNDNPHNSYEYYLHDIHTYDNFGDLVLYDIYIYVCIGDYYRYAAEALKTNKGYERKSAESYRQAYELAETVYQPTHPIRSQ